LFRGGVFNIKQDGIDNNTFRLDLRAK
jgi:hypothetical protein